MTNSEPMTPEKIAEARAFLEPSDSDHEHDFEERAVGFIRDLLAELDRRDQELERLRATINSPCTTDFLKAVPLEAVHQVERWGADHDAGKTPLDWFWLLGYLGQKATVSAQAGDLEKYRHHIITTGAALLNWFKQVHGEDASMRPGIDPVARGVE